MVRQRTAGNKNPNQKENNMRSYEYKNTARNKKVDAQVAGEELERIRIRDGNLKSDVVLKEAKPAKALLHPAFEWDNKKAGNEFRLIQSRTLIRSIRVVTEEANKPAFIHVTVKNQEEKNDSYYQDPEIIIKNVDEFAHAMREAVSKMDAATEAVKDLETFASKDKDSDRMTMIAIAIKSLETASNALGRAN